MRIIAMAIGGLAALTLVAGEADAADAKRKPPYFASIQASRARMRTGPARSYPASWLYQRADLPIRVIAVFKEWRKVEDPDGETGWMQGNLLSETRTAIVRGQPIEMRDRPSPGGKLLWRAAPGVVGRLSQCGNGWCRFDVKGQAGFVELGNLWGIETGGDAALIAALRQTLAMVGDAMMAAEDDWWVIGSAAVALHGAAPITVGDVDILVSVRDARALALRRGIEPRAGDYDALFRSELFVRWDAPPLLVEIMAGFSVRTADDWQPVRLSTHQRIEFDGRGLFVPSRDELRALLVRFGRPKDLERVGLLDAV